MPTVFRSLEIARFMIRWGKLLGLSLIVGCIVAFAVWHNLPRQPAASSQPSPATTDSLVINKPPQSPHTPQVTETCPFRFTSVAHNCGITFRHSSGTSVDKPFPAANGSGIAVLDYDRDDVLDLYFATGTPIPLDLTRTSPHNELYRQGGAWAFEDVTAPSGLGHNGFSTGLAVGDYDSDGFPDVFINCFGPNVLYHNCGDGTFERVVAGVEDPNWGTSAAFLDFDNDGLLDLYVCNYGDWTPETNQYCGDRAKNVRIFCSPHTLNGVRSPLFRNQGDGRFAEVTDTVGVGARISRSQGVVSADFNQDGFTDIYVGNDLHANAVFFNTGSGKFDDATEISGAGYDERGRMLAGMGVDVGDVTGDGNFDLFVTNFEDQINNLYENIGSGVYRDISQPSGVANGSLPWVGWGCAIRDFDLDGELDIWVVNGHVDDNLKDLGKDIPYLEPTFIWQNKGGKFKHYGAPIGDYFSVPHPARALVVADLDNDGDWDGVAGHQDAAPALLRNERLTPERSNGEQSLTLELIGTRVNRNALGATVSVTFGERTIRQPVTGGASYMSALDIRLIFAVPTGTKEAKVEILWPGGQRHSLTLPNTSGAFRIIEPTDSGQAPRVFVR